MLSELFRIVLNYISKRKIRSFLTIIGIFIGISAVVTLISLGQGLTNAVNAQFSKLGSNRLTISPAGAAGISMLRTTVKLTDKDLERAMSVQGVEYAIGVYITSKQISFGKESIQAYVRGISTDEKTIRYAEQSGLYEIEKGRDFKPGDKYKIIIGSGIAEKAFSKKVRVGDIVTIDNIPFEVIGIQKTAGSGIFDYVLRMPLDVARALDNKEDELSSISVIVKSNSDINSVEERLKDTLRRERNEKKGEESFSVQSTRNIINSFLDILKIVQALLVGIAAISLLVGAVGITNTMYTSVLERTRDIGVMKAIGAKESEIMAIFILEAGLLGLVGGIIGVVLGTAASYTIGFVATDIFKVSILKISINPPLLVMLLIFSFAIGAFAGFLPARQAAKLQPAEALRYEE
ncbi:MAG: ABC transporter permease [Candidatus Woesearchaeota archaeon]